MKTKRILAVLLALTLGLALLAPMAMAEDSPVPVFTQRLRSAYITRFSKPITLEAKAALPEGVTAELKYQWYATEWIVGIFEDSAYETLDYTPIEGAAGPKITVFCNYDKYDTIPIWSRVYCLEAYYTAANGTVVSSKSYAWVMCHPNLSDVYNSILFNPEDIFNKVFSFPIILPVYIPILFLELSSRILARFT